MSRGSTRRCATIVARAWRFALRTRSLTRCPFLPRQPPLSSKRKWCLRVRARSLQHLARRLHSWDARLRRASRRRWWTRCSIARQSKRACHKNHRRGTIAHDVCADAREVDGKRAAQSETRRETKDEQSIWTWWTRTGRWWWTRTRRRHQARFWTWRQLRLPAVRTQSTASSGTTLH